MTTWPYSIPNYGKETSENIQDTLLLADLAIAEFQIILELVYQMGLENLSVNTVRKIQECDDAFSELCIDSNDLRHSKLT